MSCNAKLIHIQIIFMHTFLCFDFWIPTVLHVNGGFFSRAIEMRRKRNIGAECECIANSMVTFFNFSLHIV